MRKKYTDMHQRGNRTVAEVRCTALFSRASPDNLAGKLSAAGTIEQAHDVPVIVYHGCKNTPLGPEKTFRAMGKARLDACLSSSSSPKRRLYIQSAQKARVVLRCLQTRHRSDLVTNARAVGLSVGPSYSKKRDRFLVIRIVY